MGSDNNTPNNNNGISYTITENEKLQNESYYLITGRINEKNIDLLKKYQISDPNSETILKYCAWNDYRNAEGYKNFIVKNSDYYQTVTTKYTLEDLKKAIREFSGNYEYHFDTMERNYNKFDTESLSIDEKKACALVISYWTGEKFDSDRVNQNTNVIARSANSEKIVQAWNDGENYYPVIYFLTKALSCLPFYWGNTIRCIQLNKQQALLYQPGIIVTWLNWSSSTIGTKPADFCKDRNCYFYIYSLSSRDITDFSNFQTEKEALYPPFSHFLVFKNVISGGHHHIYMRQIEIGLYPNNIIWVDDNIFNSNWENKFLMELAYYNSKMLKIIPKISTETAISFISSFKNIIKNGGCKYKIISDMTRYNENPASNAGARLVKALYDSGFSQLQIMIFTSSTQTAYNELNKLNIKRNKNIIITTETKDAIDYLTMN